MISKGLGFYKRKIIQIEAYLNREIFFKIVHIAQRNKSITVEALIYYVWQAPMELGKTGTGLELFLVVKPCCLRKYKCGIT